MSGCGLLARNMDRTRSALRSPRSQLLRLWRLLLLHQARSSEARQHTSDGLQCRLHYRDCSEHCPIVSAKFEWNNLWQSADQVGFLASCIVSLSDSSVKTFISTGRLESHTSRAELAIGQLLITRKPNRIIWKQCRPTRSINPSQTLSLRSRQSKHTYPSRKLLGHEHTKFKEVPTTEYGAISMYSTRDSGHSQHIFGLGRDMAEDAWPPNLSIDVSMDSQTIA